MISCARREYRGAWRKPLDHCDHHHEVSPNTLFELGPCGGHLQYRGYQHAAALQLPPHQYHSALCRQRARVRRISLLPSSHRPPCRCVVFSSIARHAQGRATVLGCAPRFQSRKIVLSEMTFPADRAPWQTARFVTSNVARRLVYAAYNTHA